jgi:hypothetical protein
MAVVVFQPGSSTRTSLGITATFFIKLKFMSEQSSSVGSSPKAALSQINRYDV